MRNLMSPPEHLGIAALSEKDKHYLHQGCHPDPFAVLGPHFADGVGFVRAYMPEALGITITSRKNEHHIEMANVGEGIFEAIWNYGEPYRFDINWSKDIQRTVDPYAFGAQLTDPDLYLFSEGRHFDIATRFGANVREVDGVRGVLFAVWAPNAMSVAVVGDFNSWDPRRHPMRIRHGHGVWELFVPDARIGQTYKYAIVTPHGERLPWKADPLARQAELPPRTASVIAPGLSHDWSDQEWMRRRAVGMPIAEPISIYEAHISAWLRSEGGQEPSWDQAIERLIPYVLHMGFTHVELMPIAEHPFGGSWGYQPLSLFAPTSRLGPPDAFARFVDCCHANGIGVILDWVPAHFPSDEHGMARFDGTALYEHQDPREGFHRDWNTLIYNAGRREVRGFLIASALWWIDAFHVDGLRVDAVASMLYRDYSRASGEWVPNHLGGRENIEFVGLLQDLNTLIGSRRGAISIAEESTAWPRVTGDVREGGLGFYFKWNMGWMHDTLQYFERDPVHRRYHTSDVTFGLQYGFSENYILPISHDEVVHGKGSLLSKMPGDDWQRFANLRLFLSMMWLHPGKKLLFMGCEFGQDNEFNVDAVFPWPHPYDERRQGVSYLVRQLNAIYRGMPSLHLLDSSPDGFMWLVADDDSSSVFSFVRRSRRDDPGLVVIANMTPIPRHAYCVGVPRSGHWVERLNTDSSLFGGSNVGNGGGVWSATQPLHGQDQSVSLTLPPLGLLLLEFRGS
jgi:1,4-alpha-glucan branching enzyme